MKPFGLAKSLISCTLGWFSACFEVAGSYLWLPTQMLVVT
jgi:hypothetical protein